MKISAKPKPGQCPVVRCLETTNGSLCARHEKMREQEQAHQTTLTRIVGSPDSGELQQLEQDKTDAGEFLAALEGIAVETSEQVELANGLLGDVKSKIKQLEGRRVSATKPMNQALREVNSWFRPVIKTYEQAEVILKAKIAAAIRVSESLQDQALAEVGAVIVPGAEIVAVAHGRDLIEQPQNISLRKVWHFEVTDAAAVPRDFCCPDERLIGEIVREHGDLYQIPGVRIYSEDQVIQRAAQTALPF